MKRKMKLATLMLAFAIAFNGFTGSVNAAKSPMIFNEGIIENKAGKTALEAVGRWVEKTGPIETSTIRAECGGSVTFEKVENVHCTGDVIIAGAKQHDAGHTSVYFFGTPAVIDGNIKIDDGDFLLSGGGKTVEIKGNVYLTSSDREQLTVGEYMNSSGMGVDGKNVRMVIEGNIYCSGTMNSISVTRGAYLEVKGSILPLAEDQAGQCQISAIKKISCVIIDGDFNCGGFLVVGGGGALEIKGNVSPSLNVIVDNEKLESVGSSRIALYSVGS